MENKNMNAYVRSHTMELNCEYIPLVRPTNPIEKFVTIFYWGSSVYFYKYSLAHFFLRIWIVVVDVVVAIEDDVIVVIGFAINVRILSGVDFNEHIESSIPKQHNSFIVISIA